MTSKIKSIYGKVSGVTNQECYFYRVQAKQVHCAAKQKRCFLCGYRVPKIEHLEPRDYIGLVNTRISHRLTLAFSSIAIIVSVLSLATGA